MPKLTDERRNWINKELVREAFESHQSALKKREEALAVRVIIERYGLYTWDSAVCLGKDAFQKFDAVPVGWLQFHVQTLAGSSYWRTLFLDEARHLPMELCRGVLSMDPSSPCGRELIEICIADETISREREKLIRDIRSTLRGFITEAQLRDGWPEAYAKMGRISDPIPNLPAVRVDELNQRIADMKAGGESHGRAIVSAASR